MHDESKGSDGYVTGGALRLRDWFAVRSKTLDVQRYGFRHQSLHLFGTVAVVGIGQLDYISELHRVAVPKLRDKSSVRRESQSSVHRMCRLSRALRDQFRSPVCRWNPSASIATFTSGYAQSIRTEAPTRSISTTDTGLERPWRAPGYPNPNPVMRRAEVRLESAEGWTSRAIFRPR